ncbi:hypothetical protein BKA61DRAFT_711903 [Leptodontidium sp. MPI-SDFR-AT-0119]|nr:hypothetical protein BKA61DRAFT_711903 [Leptodontidium sp. MPI-SDFR-AT-0119]
MSKLTTPRRETSSHEIVDPSREYNSQLTDDDASFDGDIDMGSSIIAGGRPGLTQVTTTEPSTSVSPFSEPAGTASTTIELYSQQPAENFSTTPNHIHTLEMATFAFKPYTYVPTAPRSKSTATRRRPAPEQVSILNKLQHIMSSGASLSTRGQQQRQQLMTGATGPEFELQAQGFTTGGRGPDKTGGVEEVAADETGGSVDQSRSAQSDNSGGSPDDPIVLLGDGNLSASEAEANDVSLRAESATVLGAGLFDNPETAIDSTTPAPPRSSDGWHDIDDFPEPAPRLRLAEQGASTPDSLTPHTPSRLSSEPLHDSISTDSEATTPSSNPLLHHCRASPETQLSQEGHLHTGRGVADEHGLVDHTLDTFPLDGVAREQQEVEQQKDEANSEDEDEGPQQVVNGVAPAATAEMAGGSPRPANRWQSLPNFDPPPEPRHNEAGSRCDRDSDDELNSSDSAGDDEKEPRPAKRKQPSSSHGGPARKKRRRPLQESPPRQRRPLSEPHRQYPKSHSPLDQCSRVATTSSATGRLPSPAPSMPQSINIMMRLGDSSLGRPSRATTPTLTEITFRPHSAHCYSFTAMIRDGCDGRGVSLAQLARLIANTGHVGKIDDFAIKPIEQHSYLLSGFSRHVSSRPSFGGAALSTTAEVGNDHLDATRTRPKEGRAVDAGALASQRSEPPLSSNDDGSLSDSDSESSSDDDECSAEDEQGRSNTRKNVPWDPIDEQRLLAYMKEEKPWKWIFPKFPGRTPAAIRTRWNMIRPRDE